jgi:serine/threonine-protein phosphatase 2A regulatory subunit A
LSQLLVPHLHSASKDRSWRVRYVVAEKWTELQSTLGPSVTKVDLVPILGRLLGDQEAEVRTQASFRISDVAVNLPLVDRQIVISTNILPHLAELCVDASPHVRVAVASAFVNASTVLGQEKTLESLVPLYVKLLKDESPDVRLSVIAKLDTLQSVIGVEQVCATIIPEIVALAEDQQWRVRLALIEQMPSLAHTFPADQFDQRLTGLTLSWLGDSIFAVREATAFVLKSIIEMYGVAWAKKSVVPRIVQLGQDKTYLSRLTSLLVISTIVDVVGKDIANSLVSVAVGLTHDDVPNVRFNAARTLERLVPILDKATVAKEIVPALQPLQNDKDVDVQFFSKKALSVC